MSVRSLLRPHLAGLEPYQPIHPFEVLAERLGLPPDQLVKLDANENPYGPGPKVRQALARLPHPEIYPDPDNTRLRRALTQSTGLPLENLFVGAGSDELIDLLMRVFLEPGDSLLNCPPTFAMFDFDAAVNGARVVQVPRQEDFSLDLPALERAASEGPKLLFVVSPNNPTGTVVSDSELLALLELPLVVVLDEAYIEFHGPSRMDWVLQRDNLVVLRTFSKWAGLAGLRVGYGAFPTWLAEVLWKIKQPYNVNVAATEAALASLEDRLHLDEILGRLVAERERLTVALGELDFLDPVPSRANFVLCRVRGRSAREIRDRLAQQGVLIRYYDRPGLKQCVRFSVGRPDQTDRLLEALRGLS